MKNNKNLPSEVLEDLTELEKKITQYKSGEIDEDRFKSFRLTRGVYGQRQMDVQMYRLKLPFGKITPRQLRKIADLSDQFSHGNLHLTTRQNIQLHYVKLEDSVTIWRELEEVGVTTREACGNTIRNITASPYAGIDPNEPFDVAPYAQAVFEYFLRNPICQDMGRKIKIAFSSSDEDTALTYIHDFGLIPKIKNAQRGFKVLVGGGLGAQPFVGQVAYEFLSEEKIIPFIESGIRVFDRFGERQRRNKARLKYLIEPKRGLGLDNFLKLIEKQKLSLKNQKVWVDSTSVDQEIPQNQLVIEPKNFIETETYNIWKKANIYKQKQEGYLTVRVKVPRGDIQSDKARHLADIIEQFASNDIRLTINQGLLIKFVKSQNIPALYQKLESLGFGEAGFDTLGDITGCPGTDTCNLGVTNSTDSQLVLEEIIKNEFPYLIDEANIKIKMSGCMNACGQHMIAQIGFHGSSIKHKGRVVPAMQVVMGGGLESKKTGKIAEKIIKVPTKRIPEVVRMTLRNYEEYAKEDEIFNEYYRRQGKIYFYDLLKPLANLSTLRDVDYQDWGRSEDFVPEIGVGECAGVVMDLVGTILSDAEERLNWSKKYLKSYEWANAIYYSYSTMIIAAKAILLSKEVKCNTHNKIILDFEEKIQNKGDIYLEIPFSQKIRKINQEAPSKEFAYSYTKESEYFLKKIIALRKEEIQIEDGRVVVSNFYKA